MKKVDTQALIELAESALKSADVCDAWKNKIRKVGFGDPSFKPQKMVIGGWYLEEEHGCLITPLDNNRVYGYFRPNRDMEEWEWSNDGKDIPIIKVEGEELYKLFNTYGK